MNILVSDKWLRQYVKMKQGPKEFAAAISQTGPSVERIEKQGELLDKVVVGRIISLAKHPNADKLRLARVDVGTGTLDIVCGGSNLAENQLVAVARVGARVRWHGQGEPITLEPATIRGVASEGMICGADEIGLADRFPPSGEKEIVDLTSCGFIPGTPLRQALGVDDLVYDIEVTTNRPDALGVVGLAREAAAATGGQFLWKDPTPLKDSAKGGSALKVSIAAKKLCSRYCGTLIKGVTVKDSPEWMRERLVSAGLRPLNAVVDITNFVMLELGQPMHAFDAGKIKGMAVKARVAKEGETIAALDGREYALGAGMLVIADAERPIAVAGIIGGEDSKVTAETRDIVLEAASFDATSVRETGRALNIRTDAAMRFEKRLPQGLVAPAMARAAQLVMEICGGKIAAVRDEVVEKEKQARISLKLAEINSKIGAEVTASAVKKYLASLGFEVSLSGGKATVKVPYWRAGDISIPEDLIEEVARLYGYHRLPLMLPPGVSAEAPDPIFAVEERLRRALVSAGANELVSISLVGPDLVRKSGEADAPSVMVANPLVSDLDRLRPSHRSRLLEAVRANEKMFDSGNVFEIGKVFAPAADELPVETLSLGIAVWGKETGGEAFFRAKGLLERAAAGLHAPLAFGRDFPKNGFWHPGRTASVHLGSQVIGIIGELAPDARRLADAESSVALCLVDIAELARAANPNALYRQVGEYPPVRRDIAFTLDRKAEHGFVVAAILAVDPLIASAELFDRYEGKGIEAGKKSLAYHLTYQSKERTLNSEEVENIHGRVARMLEHKFQAAIRE